MSDEMIIVTLNGHRIEKQTIAADVLEGWVEVCDVYDRGLVKKPIHTGRPVYQIITRRLYGSVRITYRGIPLLRASVGD